METVADIFGSKVFNLTTMKARLPKETYKSLVDTINNGTKLEPTVAEVVANAMKDWAIENGCTHYTHWFQPMTGVTAEKHDSFISPTDDGRVVMEFSGKELVMGEPDASSFPSGGLRATFEARGYTAWDPTSFAFIKDKTLCIPTTFFSYSGEVLDKKTPLLRSMEAINKEALRVLKYFDCDAPRVVSYVGPEQEYFLTDKELYEKRKDLMLTGRTLFGAPPAKGQELEDHYFGQIKERVSEYMKEVDEELWKLGVLAKTKHNEVAPAQHEVAPIFGTTNIATDHNQLTMEILKKVASHHGLVCLLHEKPYEGINGSGKHNNWSLGTTNGINLFKPGKKPLENKMFLLFLSAVIKAVDEYAALLRVAVATAGNDHRLGANEAPPAIVSIFLGDELTSVLKAIKNGETTVDSATSILKTGVDSLPVIRKDTTDRNRTSPFAFTGNRFEFRMPGSAQSISGINIVINTIVAEALSQFADALDAADDVHKCIDELIKDTIEKHERIIFNGNGYSDEWCEEAERRGLPNLKTTVDALPEFISDKAVAVFSKHNVFSPVEVEARYEIILEDYSKALHIEMLTMLEIAQQEILPACIKYSNDMAEGISMKKSVGVDVPSETALLKKISEYTGSLIDRTNALKAISEKVPEEPMEMAQYYKNTVIPAMNEVRSAADTLETLVGKEYWPFPTYTDLLYRI
ncbi:MAG: glutamine synthetase III [Clostridia bacterium]|nr:glutamine synthetase III [Clostridia bacterium]